MYTYIEDALSLLTRKDNLLSSVPLTSSDDHSVPSLKYLCNGIEAMLKVITFNDPRTAKAGDSHSLGIPWPVI